MADLSWAPVLCVFERVGVPEAVASGEGLATFWRPRRWCRASGEAGLDTTFEGATPGTSAERARLPGAATLPVRRARSPFDFAHALGAGFFSEAARSMGLAATGAASSHLQGAEARDGTQARCSPQPPLPYGSRCGGVGREPWRDFWQTA